ncbi:MAG TPA: biotin--[acetyl-CoA-carboxylase] ligase, partial [Kaistella sp.]|nr:biotin--[acetyl-CoA-carboxylase] ligase [Kaistella sp.]
FHTAAILRDFLANLTKTEAAIKWPNDLIIKNKKVSGILIEKKTINEKSYFIIGIGLNVLQENFENLPKAGSLLTQTGIQFNLEDLTNQLHEFILNHISEEITDENLLAKLNVNLFRKDLVSVFEIKGLRQNGIIQNVDENGFLWVDLENEGLKKFFHKEIELLY